MKNKRMEEMLRGAEACLSGECRECPYMAAGESCADELGEDMMDFLQRMKREHPDVLMAMEKEEA